MVVVGSSEDRSCGVGVAARVNAVSVAVMLTTGVRKEEDGVATSVDAEPGPIGEACGVSGPASAWTDVAVGMTGVRDAAVITAAIATVVAFAVSV